jgi:hypothetical protein
MSDSYTRHTITWRSEDGDLYVIEKIRDSLSWDFSMCENRVHALVTEIWRLKTENEQLRKGKIDA